VKKLFFRSFLLLLWVLFIALILYAPRIQILSNLFRQEEKSINVFSWGDILDRNIINAFEKETGIRVNLNYYASNEELIVKLKATQGLGYDLIVPSDYAVATLIEERLLKKIDKTKLPFWNQINQNLLGHFFDPYNHYSIPFAWEIFLFGIDKEYFSQHILPHSWQLLFDKEVVQYKISMTNDPIEAVLFASFYLFGPHATDLSPLQIKQVRELLIEQKKWVEVYASFRGDYFLATRNCPIAIASSSYILRAMRSFPFISFIIPKEGTFLAIENFVIPKLSTKEDLSYQFINYLFRESSMQTHFESFGFFPSTLQALDHLELDEKSRDLIHSTEDVFKNFYFTQEVMPEQQIRDIWIEVKSGKY